MLALNYGMSAESFSDRAKITIPEAKMIVRGHKQRYAKYWEWNSHFIDKGKLSGLVKTQFNWYYQTVNAKYRTLQNWAMQSNGSDILRLAIMMCIEHKIKVIAPVHDAILIEAPLKQIEHDVKKAQYYMELASKFVLDFPISTNAQIIRYPNHYNDPRGKLMWQNVWEIINSIKLEKMKTPILEETNSKSHRGNQ
jgi:DNA polymerase I-like protein with 3'-5' exonuclease and polymerase domains